MQLRSQRLDGRVAIVTGAGSSGPGIGTGKATSIVLAQLGAKVLLVDQVAARAGETLAEIKNQGGEASVFEADVTNVGDCHRLVAAASERYGRLDVLVNNVGIAGPGSVIDATEDQWDRVLDINLKSMVLVSKHAIPRMIESGGGSIINISSVSGLRGTASASVPYAASKGGVVALTKSMAVTHGPSNIRVNCIAPGYLYTPIASARLPAERRHQLRLAAPLQTEGTGWDVAWATAFLAGEQSQWITGVVLPVDAGLLALLP